jgi:hypothetical protein
MSGQNVGSPVQACTLSAASSAAPVTTVSTGTQPQDNVPHTIQFHFQTESGDPILDTASFELIHPDGSREAGTLKGGAFQRGGVPEGLYQMKFKQIRSCGWGQGSAVADQKVGIRVYTSGYSNGTRLSLALFQRFQPRNTTPVAVIDAKIQGDAAIASWSYQQQLHRPAGGEFIFEARVDQKIGVSDVLTVYPFPISDSRGVQQKLKQLGYDCGATDGVIGPKTTAAVRSFQQDHPELEDDGIPGPLTMDFLDQC